MDDMLAISLALGSPEQVEIVAITTSGTVRTLSFFTGSLDRIELNYNDDSNYNNHRRLLNNKNSSSFSHFHL